MIYIAYFDFDKARFKRNYVPSASNKILYIVQVLIAAGQRVNLVSASQSDEDKFFVHGGEKKVVNDSFQVCFFPTFGGKNPIIRLLRRYWGLLCLFVFLLLHAKKGEPVLVYHSTGYRRVICWAKKIKKFKLLLDVEEIYQYCANLKSNQINDENYVLKRADAYLFASDYLEKQVNKDNRRPSVVINGTYKVEPVVAEKFDDNRTHVVYSGTFDPMKGGAYGAVECAEYLDESYCIHILGFGNESQTTNLLNLIEDKKKVSKADIKYAGCLDWDDYIKYIQSCHIGLSTQSMNAGQLNENCFPSKILTYMANGLAVVSGNLQVIKDSVVGNSLSYYDEQTASAIAEAIKSARLDIDTRAVLRELNYKCTVDIKNLLNNIKTEL